LRQLSLRLSIDRLWCDVMRLRALALKGLPPKQNRQLLVEGRQALPEIFVSPAYAVG
jgi:hypothetical protein